MSREILVVIGSPRRKGNSATLAKQVASGAKASGARVETIFLQGMDIRPCTACEACRKKLKKDCIIQDDMSTLFEIWNTIQAQLFPELEKELDPLSEKEREFVQMSQRRFISLKPWICSSSI